MQFRLEHEINLVIYCSYCIDAKIQDEEKLVSSQFNDRSFGRKRSARSIAFAIPAQVKSTLKRLTLLLQWSGWSYKLDFITNHLNRAESNANVFTCRLYEKNLS